MLFTPLVIFVNLSLSVWICLDLLAMTESFSERSSSSSCLEVEEVRERRCLRLWISRLSWKFWSLYRATSDEAEEVVESGCEWFL